MKKILVLVLVHESVTDLGLFTIMWHYLLDHGLDPVTDTHMHKILKNVHCTVTLEFDIFDQII